MKIPIAKEGYPFILPLGLLTAILWALAFGWAALLCGGLFLFVIYFFRDPERQIPDDPKVVVSPADGVITVIAPEEDPLTGKTFTRISIFLSVLSVHVNRIPIAGRIEKIVHKKGKFLDARNPEASAKNERNTLLIRNENGVEILVSQITGLIARRIVCRAMEGDQYQLGERFGLIRFGSRVDLLVPENTRLKVALGDAVSGGDTVIGYLN